MSSKILFVFTSNDKTLSGVPTGWYLPEAAHPYYILSSHFSIDFAAPAGPNPPLDPHSRESFKEDKQSVDFLNDATVKAKLASAKKLSDINVHDYVAVFYPGGHGPVFDLPVDELNAKLVSDFYQAGKVVSAVCHGPAALVGGVDAAGNSIFAGKSFTGFSNTEEEIVDKVKDIPFSLEDKITSLGGKFEKAEPWQPKVVEDGILITGQNPASAAPIGQAILKALLK